MNLLKQKKPTPNNGMVLNMQIFLLIFGQICHIEISLLLTLTMQNGDRIIRITAMDVKRGSIRGTCRGDKVTSFLIFKDF